MKDETKKLKPCPWCGWRSIAPWMVLHGEPQLKGWKAREYFFHCNHCGFSSKKSRLKWRARWFWNHCRLRRTTERRYHIYGREF